MKKIIILVLAIVMLTVFLAGCAGEETITPLNVIDAGLQDLEGIGFGQETLTTPDQTQQEDESNITQEPADQPPTPTYVTEEDAEQFLEALSIFDLPFDIPPFFSADGHGTAISDPKDLINTGYEYLDFARFLLGIVEGHWRLSEIPYTILRTADGDQFEWYEYIFTQERVDVPAVFIGTVFGDAHWFKMIRIDHESGVEQLGVFNGGVTLQPEQNRIKWLMHIYLDDHINIINQGTFTQTITWYFDIALPAVGNTAIGEFYELMYPSSAETRDDRSTWIHHELKYIRVG